MIDEIKKILEERKLKIIMNLPPGRYFIIESGNLYINEQNFLVVSKDKFTKFIMHISKFEEMYG
jgi:hypothetical protein